MDAATITALSTLFAGLLAVLAAWFRLRQAAKIMEGRLVLLENQIKNVVTSEMARERIQALLDKLTAFQSDLDRLDICSRSYDRELTRISEILKSIDSIKDKLNEIAMLRSEFLEKFTQRGDFIREMQVMTSQVNMIYQKIEHVDEKMDERLRK